MNPPAVSRRLSRFTVLLALALLGSGAAAQDALPVYVAFRFKVQSEINKFPNRDPSAAETDITNELLPLLQPRLPYWKLQPGTSNDFPRLEFSLKKSGLDWTIAGNYLQRPNSVDDNPWSGILFHPADLLFTASPTPQSWPHEIIDGFEPKFLRTNLEAIRKVLEASAPLGTTFAPVVPPPPSSVDQARVILPLDWKEYSAIGTSDFLICSKWAQPGIVKLHSTGIGDSMPYPDHPNMSGIIVQLTVWEFAGTQEPIKNRLHDLAGLKPYRIYLENEETGGVALIADEPAPKGGISCPANLP